MAMSGPAAAQEVFAGLYSHAVDTPLTLGGDLEPGVDVQLGWRESGLGRSGLARRLQPYALISAHSAGVTHFAAVGLSARFGDKFYVRPGLGIAVHTGSAGKYMRYDRIAFGSRVLFEPELGVGVQIDPRWSVEASWVHLSHAQLFGRENPGMDSIGLRLNRRF